MDNYEKYIGHVFDNRYRIDALIGVGGMAVVYKAVDLLMRRIVAVKILRDDISADDASVKRFINESKAVAMLSHPNIVNIYDVSVRDNVKYIVMEYIEGITLKNYINRREVLGFKETLSYTMQILR
ncbi:MAG: protein kinase, partial [Clostridia bacterium]|nr:protein kinase [Clostridia bacterium]